MIASGSADSTVKIWDITSPLSPASTFTHHKGKVSSVAFHPSEGTILATGGFDKLVCVVDGRAPDSGAAKRAKIKSDVEEICWDPHKQERLVAAGEDGRVSCWDVRNLSSALWEFDGGAYGVSSANFNAAVPGMLATASVDKTVAIWDVHDTRGPRKVIQKEVGVGKLYTVSFYPSSELLLGCGGTGGELGLWELASERAVVEAFEGRVSALGRGGTQVDEEEAIAEAPDADAAAAGENEASRNAREGAEGKGKGGKKGKKKKKKKVASRKR